MKTVNLRMAVLALLAAFAGGLASQTVVGGRAAHGRETQAGKVIEVQAVRLVDADGRERGMLGVMPEGTGLAINDQNGKRVVMLGRSTLDGNVGTGLIVSDEQGRDRCYVGYGDGSPGFALMDHEGNPRVTFGVSADGVDCGFSVNDADLVERWSLGMGAAGIGMSFRDPQGQEKLGIGMGPGGGGDFVMKDWEGKDVWRASWNRREPGQGQ